MSPSGKKFNIFFESKVLDIKDIRLTLCQSKNDSSFLFLGFIVLAWFSEKRKKFQLNLFLFLIYGKSSLHLAQIF